MGYPDPQGPAGLGYGPHGNVAEGRPDRFLSKDVEGERGKEIRKKTGRKKYWFTLMNEDKTTE